MKGNVNRTFFHGEIKFYFGSHVNTLLEEERMTISLSQRELQTTWNFRFKFGPR